MPVSVVSERADGRPAAHPGSERNATTRAARQERFRGTTAGSPVRDFKEKWMDGMTTVLIRAVLFAALALSWTLVAGQARAAAERRPDSIKLLVDEDRMYRVTGRELAELGVDAGSILPEDFNIHHKGETVPIRFERMDSKGRMGPGSSIVFWGEYPRGDGLRVNKYTTLNAYFLRFDGAEKPNRFVMADAGDAAGSARESETAQVQTWRKTLHLEEDKLVVFHTKLRGDPTDRVFWAGYRSPPRKSWGGLYIPPLTDLAPGSQPSALRILMWGNTYLGQNPDHDWNVRMNGETIGRAQWDDRSRLIFEVDDLGDAFNGAKGNTVNFYNAHEEPIIDGILVDWMEIDYIARLMPMDDSLVFNMGGLDHLAEVRLDSGFGGKPVRVFDIRRGLEVASTTQYSEPKWAYGVRFNFDPSLHSGEFAAVGPRGYSTPNRMIPRWDSDLRDLAEVPEYVVISHARFMAPAQRLIDHRRSQGLSSLLVDVEDIYDAYGDGLFGPEAIRLFIDDLLERSQLPDHGLRYVMLVGDASYDYRGVKNAKINYLPTHHTDSNDNYTPFYANDDYFAYGKGDGLLPLAAVGRFPCKEPEQFDGFVDKIIDYESNPRIGYKDGSDAVTGRALLIASKGWVKNCDRVAGKTLENFETTKVYSVDMDNDANIQLQADIVNAINAGTDFVYFVGHGGEWMWRTGSSTDLSKQVDMFSNRHIDQLTNKGHYPIVFAATCYSSLFDTPTGKKRNDGRQIDSGVGVYFVEAAERGAIACIGSTTSTTVPPVEGVTRRTISALIAQPGMRLGDAIREAKETPNLGHIALIGDPATIVGAPRSE